MRWDIVNKIRAATQRYQRAASTTTYPELERIISECSKRGYRNKMEVFQAELSYRKSLKTAHLSLSGDV
jgi:hypothetical protein